LSEQHRYEQFDAQEFFKLLLPSLPTRTQSLFEGTIINKIEGGGETRLRPERMFDVSLTVNQNSLESNLKNLYCSPEKLLVSEGNGWVPPSGGDKVDALKGERIGRPLPAVLQIHLKRFSYEWETGRSGKIFDEVLSERAGQTKTSSEAMFLVFSSLRSSLVSQRAVIIALF